MIDVKLSRCFFAWNEDLRKLLNQTRTLKHTEELSINNTLP